MSMVKKHRLSISSMHTYEEAIRLPNGGTCNKHNYAKSVNLQVLFPPVMFPRSSVGKGEKLGKDAKVKP